VSGIPQLGVACPAWRHHDLVWARTGSGVPTQPAATVFARITHGRMLSDFPSITSNYFVTKIYMISTSARLIVLITTSPPFRVYSTNRGIPIGVPSERTRHRRGRDRPNASHRDPSRSPLPPLPCSENHPQFFVVLIGSDGKHTLKAGCGEKSWYSGKRER
jgi:hypothetical protein